MDVKLKALNRELTGRKVKKLRKEGIVPANIFGKKVKSQAIQADETDLLKVYEQAGETTLIHIQLETSKGKTQEKVVLISNVQQDPVTGRLMHVDFKQVDLKDKVKAQVPVELIGESPAEEQKLGTVVQYINEIEVEALPTDLPESFELDQSVLTKVDSSITVSDLRFNKDKVTVEMAEDVVIAKVEELSQEEPEETAAEEEAVAEEESSKEEASQEESSEQKDE